MKTPLSRAEFDEVLRPEKRWAVVTAGREYLYVWEDAAKTFKIKVFSGVLIENWTGRNRGTDSIRVYAFVPGTEESKAAYRCKVHPSKGWQQALRDHVMSAHAVCRKRTAR